MGGGYSCYLILSDDASKDRTLEIVESWLLKHAKLFKEVKKLYHTQNKGTCYNYTDGIREVRTEEFQVLDGDDLFTISNIFKIHEEYKEYDVVACNSLIFEDGEIVNERKRYSSIIRQAIYTPQNLSYWTKIGVCPIRNGYIIKRHMYTDEVLSFIRDFRLIEDKTLWYKVFNSGNSVSYKYCNVPTILYRRSINSVTNVKNQFHILCRDDNELLYKKIYSAESKLYIKYVLRLQKLRKSTGWRRVIGKLFNFQCLYEIAILIIHRKQFSEILNELLKVELVKNQEYLRNFIMRGTE